MEMKKIVCATLVAAASMCAVMGESEAPAPAPASNATIALPVLGSLVGASLLSFFTLYTN
ncbi:hypothetical protein LguiA_034560 [Lonicera macranthoides]